MEKDTKSTNAMDCHKHSEDKEKNPKSKQLQNGNKLFKDGELVNLESLMVSEVGDAGKWQVLALCWFLLEVMMLGWSSGEYVFTTARINTRCLIEECESDNIEFSPSWLSNAVPLSGGGSFDSCTRYGNVSQTFNVTGSDVATCPADIFDNSVLRSCDKYVYENDHSIVYDFGLGCMEWRRSGLGSVKTSGALVALLTAGFVSDALGRRRTVAAAAGFTSAMGLARAFSRAYWQFALLEFLEAALGYGAFSCGFVLLMEIFGPKYRVVAAAIINITFSMGHVTLAVIASYLPHWRSLYIALYAPHLLLAVGLYWLLPESPRLLAAKGNFIKAKEVLEKGAIVNGKVLSEETKQHFCEAATFTVKTKKEDKPWLFLEVVRSKALLRRCLIVPVWWVSAVTVFYGLGINAVNLSGNKFVNYALVSLVDVPGYGAAALALSRGARRRPLLLLQNSTLAACMLAYCLLPAEATGWALCVYLVGKVGAASLMTVLYVMTSELFPTERRHALLALCSAVGRLGAILAPLTPALSVSVWEPLPFVLFGGMSALSASLTFAVPETAARPLPDTLRDAERRR